MVAREAGPAFGRRLHDGAEAGDRDLGPVRIGRACPRAEGSGLNRVFRFRAPILRSQPYGRRHINLQEDNRRRSMRQTARLPPRAALTLQQTPGGRISFSPSTSER